WPRGRRAPWQGSQEASAASRQPIPRPSIRRSSGRLLYVSRNDLGQLVEFLQRHRIVARQLLAPHRIGHELVQPVLRSLRSCERLATLIAVDERILAGAGADLAEHFHHPRIAYDLLQRSHLFSLHAELGRTLHGGLPVEFKGVAPVLVELRLLLRELGGHL